MGVRAYDPARGLWKSPDLYIGQSLEKTAGAGQVDLLRQNRLVIN